jgi:hypothetical protein
MHFDRETALAEDVDHATVVRQHLGGEHGDAVAVRNGRQVSEHDRRDAVALPGVGDEERDLSMHLIGTNVGGVRDDLMRGSRGRDQGVAVAIVDVHRPVRRQSRFAAPKKRRPSAFDDTRSRQLWMRGLSSALTARSRSVDPSRSAISRTLALGYAGASLSVVIVANSQGSLCGVERSRCGALGQTSIEHRRRVLEDALDRLIGAQHEVTRTWHVVLQPVEVTANTGCDVRPGVREVVRVTLARQRTRP